MKMSLVTTKQNTAHYMIFELPSFEIKGKKYKKFTDNFFSEHFSIY